MKYDFIIVGAGLSGSVLAGEMNKAEKKYLVADKRNHFGGNVYFEDVEGINVHKCGAHIFHTNSKKIWDHVNSFAEFNQYANSPMANYERELLAEYKYYDMHQVIASALVRVEKIKNQ